MIRVARIEPARSSQVVYKKSWRQVSTGAYSVVWTRGTQLTKAMRYCPSIRSRWYNCTLVYCYDLRPTWHQQIIPTGEIGRNDVRPPVHIAKVCIRVYTM